MTDLEGALLGDYLLVKRLSNGGIADVYRGYHHDERYEVAVKVFRPTYAQRSTFRAYFLQEMDKIGRFSHSNILPLLECGEGDDLLYVVTPYMAAGTLEHLLHRVGGRLSALQALPLVQQLCSALQYVHERECIHGNIKPSNIFVGSDGRMLLTDFGTARGFDDTQASLTRVGWGSAEYVSPEQSLGVMRPVSDIYSLGVILFRVITGVPPFSGQTPIEVLLKHVRQEPPRTSALVPQISHPVDEVMQQVLHKRMDKRYSSAREFCAAFEHAVMVAPIASPFTHPLVGVASVPAAAVPQTPLPASLDFSPTDAVQVLPPLSPSLVAAHDASPPEVQREQMAYAEPPLPIEDGKESHGEQGHQLFWTPEPEIGEQDSTDPAPPLAAWFPTSSLSSSPTPGQNSVAASLGLKKWLPLVVVVLLLLGLLGALLSSLFFLPT